MTVLYIIIAAIIFFYFLAKIAKKKKKLEFQKESISRKNQHIKVDSIILVKNYKKSPINNSLISTSLVATVEGKAKGNNHFQVIKNMEKEQIIDASTSAALNNLYKKLFDEEGLMDILVVEYFITDPIQAMRVRERLNEFPDLNEKLHDDYILGLLRYDVFEGNLHYLSQIIEITLASHFNRMNPYISQMLR